MTKNLDAKSHAESWIEAWNSHDLDRILSHYAEDVVFEAQTVVLRWNQPEGRLLGKDALRKHFASGLQLAPHLHFTLEDIFLTPSGYAILYHRENGNRVIDAVTVNQKGLCSHVIAYYKSAQR
jgi:ketosteroid isomerase-like protein